MPLVFLLAALVFPPQQDPAWTALNRAYEQVLQKQYDEAIASFRRVLVLNPSKVTVYKDLAYTLQKTGEAEQAVEAFEAYHKAVPEDFQTIMELAYLYAQVQKEDQSLEFFRLAMNSPDAAQAAQAKQAYEAVGGPIIAEISRWSAAVAQDPNNFDARESLADAYVRHGDAAQAIEQFAWLRKQAPSRYRHLITLSELHAKLGGAHADIAHAYALLAMRSPDARVSAQGRAMFGERYPYLYELTLALELEPWQQDVAKEVAYVRGDRAPTPAPPPPAPETDSVRAHKDLGYASIAKSFLSDAAREFEYVHKLDPKDDSATLQLGYIYNMMKQDAAAIRWFKLARSSSDQKVAAQAKQALHNLETPLFTTTVWAQPLVSSRFSTAFGYGQIKSELNIGNKRVRPYFSVRFEGDSRTRTGGTSPEVLSADGGIAAFGAIATVTNHLWAWGEAGNALSAVTAPSHPDYRAGLAYARAWGPTLFSNERGRFADTNVDAVYLSRVNQDAILYAQTKSGYQLPPVGAWHHQVFLAANYVTDRNRDVFSNFVEFGPAYRFGWKRVPHLWAYATWLRGVYTLPGKQNYNDLRLVVWWAKTF